MNKAASTPRQSIRQRLQKVSLDAALRHGIALFVVMRVVVSVWVALVLGATGVPTSPDDVLRPYQGMPAVQGGIAELSLGVWQRFDTLWYLRIAAYGYAPDDGSTVYFPLYPLLIRLLGQVFFGNYLLAALIISSLAYVGVLFCLYKLTEARFGKANARRSITYLAVFPTAFFFLAAYTESLFLFLTLAAFLCACRGRWWLAGTLGLLSSLTRLQGVVLIAPLLYIYLRDREFRLSRLDRRMLALLLIPLGTMLYLGYQYLVLGATPLVDTYQAQLHAQFVWPWENVLATLQKILSPEGTFINVLNLGMTGVFLAMTVLCFGRLPAEYGIYMAVTMVVLMLRRTTLQPLVSMSRYVLVLFPTFMLWGRWGRNPRIQRLIVYPSVALLLYLSGQFAMWGWVA
jgi:hypothetical protein